MKEEKWIVKETTKYKKHLQKMIESEWIGMHPTNHLDALKEAMLKPKKVELNYEIY